VDLRRYDNGPALAALVTEGARAAGVAPPS
jgi:hypothetical protein